MPTPISADPNLVAQILTGRKAVDAYREAHRLLHEKPYYKGVHDDHMPLLETMKAALKKQGFDSLDAFWDASDDMNIKELGFKNRENFEAKATEVDRISLQGKWR